MSAAKRPRPESAHEEAADDAEPYRTYGEAHAALVGLGRDGDAAGVAAGRRARATVGAAGVPEAVQQLAVRLMARACAQPATDAAQMARALAAALATAAASVRCEAYQALVAVHELKAAALDGEARGRLAGAVGRDVNHAQHRVRCAALAAAAAVPGGAAAFGVLSRFSGDAHPKARQAALGGILRQHMAGARLPVELYDECVVATKDDAEQVRLAAVELVWAVGSAHPEQAVALARAETIRLVDDAFVKVCDMVNDGAVAVRQRACAVLRRFRGVDERFLSQTLSKQVMTNMRRHAPRGGRGYAGRNQGVRGARGRQAAAAAAAAAQIPEGDASVEADEIRLLDSGAAGAFVHGLEDEYQEVRDAAIASIAELSLASAAFAARAVDFLVDMFNDSSDRVRLCAIRALAALGARAPIALTDEQLAIALSAMKDASHAVREGIYAFLGCATPGPGAIGGSREGGSREGGSKEGGSKDAAARDASAWLQRVMDALRANLDRYPADQRAIHRAAQALGRSHSAAVTAPLVRALLGISEHYLSREARIDDAAYAACVILIMNTRAATRQALAAVVPDYVFGHLPYLRDKYPGCLPPDIAASVPPRLPFVRRTIARPRPDPGVAAVERAAARSRVAAAAHAAAQALAAASGDSDTDPSADPDLDARLRAAARLPPGPATQAQAAVAAYAGLVADARRAQAGGPHALGAAARVMDGAYALAARTLGLDARCLLALAHLRVLAHAAWLGAQRSRDSALAARLHDELRQRAARVRRGLERAGLDVPPPLAALAHAEPAAAAAAAAAFVAAFRPLALAPPGCCQRARARLADAQQQQPPPARRAAEFNHLFPLPVAAAADLDWVARRRDVLVTVRLPTQQTLALQPPPAALRPARPLHWALRWPDIPVALPLGSGEPAALELSVALRHPADVPWTDLLVIAAAPVPPAHTAAEHARAVAAPAAQDVRVEIADRSVLLSVSPIEFRAPASAHTRA
ncbi:hypothetical protein H4R18_000172 [Coemansia javaensis]|uniref:Integrator complex subunit 4 n=1 Tax=Coemansia javaensis TaxID=2761396 RepID=A0A9W8HKD0_9FUNG|nr:hypothetical protein H4R18_000172 [Coemansia javaensis]